MRAFGDQSRDATEPRTQKRVWKFEIVSWGKPPKQTTSPNELFFLRRTRSRAATAQGAQNSHVHGAQVLSEGLFQHWVLLAVTAGRLWLAGVMQWDMLTPASLVAGWAAVCGPQGKCVIGCGILWAAFLKIHVDRSLCSLLSGGVMHFIISGHVTSPVAVMLTAAAMYWPTFPRNLAPEPLRNPQGPQQARRGALRETTPARGARNGGEQAMYQERTRSRDRERASPADVAMESDVARSPTDCHRSPS